MSFEYDHINIVSILRIRLENENLIENNLSNRVTLPAVRAIT